MELHNLKGECEVKKKKFMLYEGKKYYSAFAVAQLLGTNVAKVKKIIGQEKLEWFIGTRDTLWVDGKSVDELIKSKKQESGSDNKQSDLFD